jgi:hypothetical protein
LQQLLSVSAAAKITFQPEMLEHISVHSKQDFALLDHLHAEHTQGRRPRAYDFDAYLRMERAGMLKSWGARDGGRAIGLVTYFVRHNIHYGPDWKTALHDIWFVEPEYRSGIVPARLWITAERGLRSLGVKSILHGMSPKNDHVAVLARAGYRVIETVFEKVL